MMISCMMARVIPVLCGAKHQSHSPEQDTKRSLYAHKGYVQQEQGSQVFQSRQVLQFCRIDAGQ